MKKIIESIISEIRNGAMFDSHFVIDKIIRDQSDAYLRFAAKHLSSSGETEYAHSQLAKLISSFEGILVEQQPDKAYSYNIRGKASECALWRRVKT